MMKRSPLRESNSINTFMLFLKMKVFCTRKYFFMYWINHFLSFVYLCIYIHINFVFWLWLKLWQCAALLNILWMKKALYKIQLLLLFLSLYIFQVWRQARGSAAAGLRCSGDDSYQRCGIPVAMDLHRVLPQIPRARQVQGHQEKRHPAHLQEHTDTHHPCKYLFLMNIPKIALL